MEDTKPKIIIGNKGPLIIKGGVTLIHPDGLEEQQDGTGSPLPLRAFCQKTIL